MNQSHRPTQAQPEQFSGEAPPRSAIPTATYRLQLHAGFTLHDAAGLVPYFQQLGISHLYLSPIQVARAGSMHGYDVIDHREINPELGGEPALRALAARCQRAGLGIVVDIVPNHMAVGGADNRMWLDVLENGEASRFATMFDVDFGDAASCGGKILLPVLGEPYGDALQAGKVALIWDASLQKLAFAYGPHRFPLRPDDYDAVTGGRPAEAADLQACNTPERLHELLDRQHFRLAWWNAAGDAINWRRFFDVNELAGLRMEDDAVFQLTHGILLRLYEDGIIDGVRIDHVDGLADPAAYLKRLRQALEARSGKRPAGAPQDGPYIVVEKILGPQETLPSGWPVHGTTGYDFMDQVNGLQHDPAGEKGLDALWAQISGSGEDFAATETAARLEVLQGAFAGQLANCADAFAQLAAAGLSTRDITGESFRRVLVSLISQLRRYRTYATGREESPPPDAAFLAALDAARAALPADAAAADFIADILAGAGPDDPAGRKNAARRLNQLSAPVAAKAVEDTAFYRYSRLLSRNDVGFEAGRLALSISAFIATGQERARRWPRAMLATATHDHKRGEDVRARLAVLSEVPDTWRDAVQAWFAATQAARPASIAADDAYSLFQTLAGAWPLDLAADDEAGLHAFAERIAAWRIKSLREAKLRSSWSAPDLEYEAANIDWLHVLLDPGRSATFLASLAEFVGRIAPAGAINGLVQAGLRCCWPGIPDLYQGAELWDFSLVDPDNRRPVDFGLRRQLLQRGENEFHGGAVKQALIARLLRWRRNDAALFSTGALAAVPVRGARADHVLAFTRAAPGRTALFAAMLRVAEPCRELGRLPAAAWWADTEILTGAGWRRAAVLFEDSPFFAEPDREVVTQEEEERILLF